MKIVVCIKQVPGSANVGFDPATKRLRRQEGEAVMNPFDTYGLEQGMLIKEKLGGEVIALSMGPARAEQTLREAVACGADKAILLSAKEFEGADAWVTAYVLSRAIRTIGNVDLVICGKQAVDGDTAQVGPGIAGQLGWPQAAYVSAMPEFNAGSVIVRRMREDGYDECELVLPALITVVKDINVPRIPSLKGRMAAKKAEILVWGPLDIGADPCLLGPDVCPAAVTNIEPAPVREKGTIVIQGEAAEAASLLLKELRTRMLV